MSTIGYKNKYDVTFVSVFGNELGLSIKKVGTHRVVEIQSRPMIASWAKHWLRTIPDLKSRQQLAMAFRIADPCMYDSSQIIHDDEERAKFSDGLAEWFYVIATRIQALEEMAINGDPIILVEG